MGRTTPHSVLALRLVVTLCISPLLNAGLDRKISPDDLRRSLERMQAESSSHYIDRPEAVTDVIQCVEKLCDEFTKQLVIREVVMRNSFKNFDEACTSHNDEKLLRESPDPFAAEDEPYNENYVKWQNKVLDSGKVFCDPFKNLFCSSENKRGCGPGKKFKTGATPKRVITFVGRPPFTANTCIIPLGGQCTAFPEAGAYFFDALKPLFGILDNRPDPIDCERNITCSPNFRDYFMGSVCLNDDLDKRLNNVKKYFNEDVKGLKSGESCNLDGHNQLYKSEALDSDFNVRLKALESFQSSGDGVCDLEKCLTCGKSGKCECLEPTVLEGSECALPVSQRTCGKNPAVKAMIMTNGFVSEAQRRLVKGIEKLSMDACGPKSRCYVDIQNASGPNDVDMFCICKGFFTGEGCDEALTLFLPFIRGTFLPLDVKDAGEKLKIFSDFNKEAIKFQEKLKLKSGEKCDFYKELEIRRLIRRIDSLKDRSTKMTKVDYENLISEISKFTQSGEQYCLRNFDPKRSNFDQDFFIEHSPYNQSRVCHTPLRAADRQRQGIISSSHKKTLETYFSTLGCGELCTASIDDAENGANIKFNIDRAENYMYNKTAFCVQPTDAAVRIMCETEKNGVTRKCVCRSNVEERCQKACSSDTTTSPGITTGPNSTNHGVSCLDINGGGDVILLFVVFTLLI